MNLYMWRQNNSGGYFTLPAIHILVEADTEQKAQAAAVKKWGIRFNDPDDCKCCGYRWTGYSLDWSMGSCEQMEGSLKEVIEELVWLESLDFWNDKTTRKGEPLPLYAVKNWWSEKIKLTV